MHSLYELLKERIGNRTTEENIEEKMAIDSPTTPLAASSKMPT